MWSRAQICSNYRRVQNRFMKKCLLASCQDTAWYAGIAGWLSPSIQAILHGYISLIVFPSLSVCLLLHLKLQSILRPHTRSLGHFTGEAKALFGKQQKQKLIESRETTPDKSRAGKWKTQNDIPQNADGKKIGDIFVILWTARRDSTIRYSIPRKSGSKQVKRYFRNFSYWVRARSVISVISWFLICFFIPSAHSLHRMHMRKIAAHEMLTLFRC